MDRLREVEDERLRRGVGGVVRDRLERCHRGDVDDRPALAWHHGCQRRVGEPQHSAYVQIQLRHLPLHRQLAELARRAEAGVVHQHVDLTRTQPLLDERETVLPGQVRLDRVGGDAVFGRELGGERVEAVLTPGDEHQVVTLSRHLPREPLADAGRCAGDQRSFGRSRCVVGHPFHPFSCRIPSGYLGSAYAGFDHPASCGA